VRTLPDPEVAAVLKELLSSVMPILGDCFVGMYVQGSLAVGGFDEHSDIDFVVAITEEVSDDQLSALQAMHARIHAMESKWAVHIEGSYIPTASLRRYDATHPPHLFLDHGSKELIRSQHDNSVVVRHTVREMGITLAGPDPRTLIDPIPPEEFRKGMWAVLHDWSQAVFANPAEVSNRWYQSFAVLGMCRVLYTFEHCTVVSKCVAAQWARSSLDRRWSELIDKAWADRPYPTLKVRQQADHEAVSATLGFIRYSVELGQQYVSGS